MLNCLIIEDDALTVNMLKSIVSTSFSDVNIKGDATTIKDGISLIAKENPDFIFLDVNLEDGNSFELLKHFPHPNFKIIFITSYSKYAVEAFKFSALDFVLKPFTADDIITAITKVTNHISAAQYSKKVETFFHNQNSAQKKLILSNEDSINVIPISEILYAKSDNSYTTFFINDGREILVSKSLKYYDNELHNYSFFRIHQKYLINLHQLKQFNKKSDEIVLSNNTSLAVAKSKRAILLKLLNSN